MSKKLFLLFLGIIVIPLGAVLFLGIRTSRNQQIRENERLSLLLENRLKEIDSRIVEFLRVREDETALFLSEITFSRSILREKLKDQPFITYVFLQDSSGELIYPDRSEELSLMDEDFFTRTASIWNNQIQFSMNLPDDTSEEPRDNHGFPDRSGWYFWFYGDGLHFIYWTILDDGTIAGAEMNKYALISAIISLLPETKFLNDEEPLERGVLLDSNGVVLSQWGNYSPDKDEQMLVEIKLSYPLSSWHLGLYPGPGFQDENEGNYLFIILSGSLALGIVLVLLVVFFWMEQTRTIRLASRQVSFVNQVSHELKTPLTNIRMYAELMENRITGTGKRNDDSKNREYLQVILRESERLSRLIQNVLSFAKSDKNTLQVRRTKGVPDQVIGDIIHASQPLFDDLSFDIKFTGGADTEVCFDHSILEQILYNLISNGKKYASGGSFFRISSSILEHTDMDTRDSEHHPGNTAMLQVDVFDDGPGISPAFREKIFDPFFRVSNKLTDGVSGAGIGLTISRDLALRHGGSLSIIPSGTGAHFRILLDVECEGG